MYTKRYISLLIIIAILSTPIFALEEDMTIDTLNLILSGIGIVVAVITITIRFYLEEKLSSELRTSSILVTVGIASFTLSLIMDVLGNSLINVSLYHRTFMIIGMIFISIGSLIFLKTVTKISKRAKENKEKK